MGQEDSYIKIIRLDETDSTNRWMAEYKGTEGRILTVALAENQTAGKGMGSNKWESEKGKNLTFSVLIRPNALKATKQFAITEATALSLLEALGTFGEGFSIKWPNDIYWNDRKISGTLSECSITGGIVVSCIIGIGININQEKFLSDAPNPASLRYITGMETDREWVLSHVLRQMASYKLLIDEGKLDDINRRYREKLYRKEGIFAYRDHTGEFRASMEGITEIGRLRLRTPDGNIREYGFKEVEYIL